MRQPGMGTFTTHQVTAAATPAAGTVLLPHLPTGILESLRRQNRSGLSRPAIVLDAILGFFWCG
ncbi:MAG: hypothetical protein ACK4RS_06250, partial [Thiothrix sp.]